MNHTPYNYLPPFARIAIERIDNDYANRNTAKLLEYIHAYATTYPGAEVTQDTIESSIHICSRRFPNFNQA